jgi:hypothetical protein
MVPPGSAEGDPFIGTYEGVFRAIGLPDRPANAAVVSTGEGGYRAVLSRQPIAEDLSFFQFEIPGQFEAPKVVFDERAETVRWIGELADDHLVISRRDTGYGGVFDLKKVVKHSPTEGQAPPQGALVLLPYTPGKAPDTSAWTNQKWKPLEEGTLQVTPDSESNTTKESFGSIQLHVEFSLPNEMASFGQGRSNSGLYLQSRYEVQILDSFGVISGAGDCGAIYDISTPKVNASFPPEQWQTYDVLFHAAHMNPDGTVRDFPRITVRHNGILVQDDVELTRPCIDDLVPAVVERDRIILQDHGDLIRFRNIWLVKID